MPKRILLVAPTVDPSRGNWGAPPLGLWRIASHLMRHGHYTEVYDIAIDSRFPEGPWDIIGFSTTHDTLPTDLAIANKLASDHPEAIIVFGGVEATLNYQQIFEHCPACRYVVLGEGEEAMLAIAEGMEPSGAIKRTYNEICQEEFVRWTMGIDFTRMRYEEYWKRTASFYEKPNWDEICTVRLVTSSHCNRNCAFCSVTRWHRFACGRTLPVLYLPATEVKELVLKVKRQVPLTRTIYFCEDSFCFDRDRVVQFFEDPPPLRYLVQAGLHEVDQELVEIMAAGGCVHLTIGIENCSPRIQKSFGKIIDMDKADSLIGWCRDVGIQPYYLIILFAPDSLVEDLVVNYKTLRKWISMGAVISIEPYLRAYRGTRLFESLHEIEFTKSSGVKQPNIILPSDPTVRRILYRFRKEIPERIAKIKHQFKGATGPVMVDLLGELLKAEGINC